MNPVDSVHRKLIELTVDKTSGAIDSTVNFAASLVTASAKETLNTHNVHAAQDAELVRLKMIRKTLSGRDNDYFDTGEDSGFHGRFCSHSLEGQNNDVLSKVVTNYSDDNNIATIPHPLAQPHETARDISLLIERASKRYGVEKNLIRAVIKVESDFSASAVSTAGAQGLMQLMPATSSDLGVTNPFDPEQNIMAGTRFLKNLLVRYGGDIDKSLAAYNWGPGNLDRKRGLLPKETRQYISKIRHLLNEYQSNSG
jgi:hypothetical protein